MSEIRFNRWSHQSGTGGIYQNSSGSVGIGTSIPSSSLDIQGGDLKIGNYTLSSNSSSLNVNGDITVAGTLTYEDVTNIDSVGVVTARSGLHVTGGSVGIGTDNPSGNFDIFNTSRIKHVVASNTNHIEFWKDLTPTYAASIGLGVPAGGSLNQDLTFSTYVNGGSWNERLRITSAGLVSIPVSGNLQVGAAGSPETDSKVYVANTGGDAYIQVKGADSTGTVGLKFGRNSVANRAGIDWSASTDALCFRTGGTNERLRITSGGNVGIGTDNPNRLLHLKKSSGGGMLTIERTDSNSSALVIAADPGEIALFARDSDTGSTAVPFVIKQGGSTEALRIDSSGNVNIANGNLVFSTSGTGIDFSATSDASGSTSELLDDYEEGIWTPTIRLDGGTANGTTVSPEAAQYKGRYVKIGDMVFVEAYVRYNFSSLSGTWNTVAIQGLPYTQGDQNSQQYTVVNIGYLSNFYSGFPTTSNNFPAGYVRTGQSDLVLTINNPNGTETTISNTVLSSNSSAGIMFSAYYRDSNSG